jgi:hypothetical protein
MPQTESLGVVDPYTESEENGAAPSAPAAGTRAPTGPPAMLALEVDAPPAPWPPQVSGVTWRDLGLIDGRQDRQHALEQLADPQVGSSSVVVVCGLTTTPDRGHGAFIAQVREASGAPVGVVLTGGEAFRRRGDADQLEGRIEDWRALADRAGVPTERVVEVDLDHLTDASAAILGELAGAGPAAAGAGRRIESAFDLIVEHMGGWTGDPDEKQRVQLHGAITGLYRSEAATWQAKVGATAERLKSDLAGGLRGGAESVVGMLPERLKSDARWIAAGAAAGAIGCVAAAALAAPAVIGSLPVWTGLGAAVAAVIRASRTIKQASGSPEPLPPSDCGDAVRAAALFALLLELQGRDEAAITRILDETVGDEEPPEIETSAAARTWLDGLRHRLDLALGREAAP